MNLSNLSFNQLLAIVTDAQYRIGSHVAGGMPNDDYVESQRRIIESVQSEITNREE